MSGQAAGWPEPPQDRLGLRERPSPNHDARPEGVPINMLVLHYTGMQSAQAALDRLCDPAPPAPLPPVSCHYVVEEDGRIWRLVPEARRAWHAGQSYWRGHTLLNARSIGIEIVNPGHEWGYRPFPALQMAAVAELCLDILARHPIPPRNVVGHSDIAPDRKQDPGELFDWEGLAALGIGLWPAGGAGGDSLALPPGAAGRATELLGRIGYPLDPARPELAIAAFQRHWRPEAVTGQPDSGTLARMAAVAALAESG
ncbi:N-acetylmuramoyl-L-alanine amidase [Pseudoroseomonas cervicalis]|uniref:N-acetylmuramoyl-L-alanine amidase n=1 Tax=Teichococcus cervicalis TaxID=204525 RepID=UPI0022F17AE5|nr:N-acetylmuramoyl-L-alanine amidase [Pseudoroseomonas cervicalis]WBV44221.1 N-acetylmuramoyl-L-alanine amidase [Pseudoroseomonas cervicalis]